METKGLVDYEKDGVVKKKVGEDTKTGTMQDPA